MDNLKIADKYMLTIREASVYFNIGDKKIRRLVEDNEGGFSVLNGNRYLIIRPLMEQYFAELAQRGGNQDAESNTGE
ncbi:MAG: excisionase family DNA-binding protein [Oscillospiraceae bacterium]|nr:excisionase family DNA-binding protein [Oscillospiraceae bacterium]